jgi:RNA recognition motif-containing protein
MKRPSGYAFATYKSKEQAQKVVDELNGTGE